MNNILPYLAIFLIFFLKLFSVLSISPAMRAKFDTATILGLVGLCAYLYYIHMFDIPYLSSAHILTYTIVLPEVIARIINLHRIKSRVVQVDTSMTNSVLGFIGSGIFLIVTVVIIYLMIAEIKSPKDETVFDIKYFLVWFNFLLVLISISIWMYLFATQKTIFHSEGVLYNGEIWKWSDFDTYSWSKRMFENDLRELALATAKHVRLPAQIKIKIPSESKERVDNLLEKNLESL